jgi:hypothetical protein
MLFKIAYYAHQINVLYLRANQITINYVILDLFDINNNIHSFLKLTLLSVCA